MKDELLVARSTHLLQAGTMKRLLPLLALLPAACSPPADQPAGRNEPAAELVPYSKIQWKEDVNYLEGKPFTGVTVQHHKNGQLMSRYHMKDGVYHGLVEEWYEDGRQKTKTSFERGKHEGDNLYWNPDGTLQVHKVWKEDILVSENSVGGLAVRSHVFSSRELCRRTRCQKSYFSVAQIHLSV